MPAIMTLSFLQPAYCSPDHVFKNSFVQQAPSCLPHLRLSCCRNQRTARNTLLDPIRRRCQRYQTVKKRSRGKIDSAACQLSLKFARDLPIGRCSSPNVRAILIVLWQYRRCTYRASHASRHLPKMTIGESLHHAGKCSSRIWAGGVSLTIAPDYRAAACVRHCSTEFHSQNPVRLAKILVP